VFAEDEAERLDEQNLIEDELAERLRLVEDDLLDAYASGTLSADRRAGFETYYLASRRRRKGGVREELCDRSVGPATASGPRQTRENRSTPSRVWSWTPARPRC
jgi:hypothetical protein